jgi:hypothetical protein
MENLSTFINENLYINEDIKDIKQYAKTIDKDGGRISVDKTGMIKLPIQSWKLTFTEAIPEGASFEEISNPNLFFKKKADQNTFDTVMKYINWRDVNYIELNWDIEDINNMDTLNEYAKDIDNGNLSICIRSKMDEFNADYKINILKADKVDNININIVNTLQLHNTNFFKKVSAKLINELEVCPEEADLSKVKKINNLVIDCSHDSSIKAMEKFKFPKSIGMLEIKCSGRGFGSKEKWTKESPANLSARV